MTSLEPWLLALADPESAHESLPETRLDASAILSLCLQAEFHGVLPATLNHLDHLIQHSPERVLADAASAGKILPAMEPVRKKVTERSVMSMFLAAESRKLLRELRGDGVEVMVLKGPDFASRLYAQPVLRPFIDLDLLIRADDWARAEAVMSRLKFVANDPELKYDAGYAERTWEHPAMPGAMIEVHDNLVNSPTVRHGVSVRLEDLPLEPGPDGRRRPAAAGLLIIAAVHAGASHSFDKLQHLCDLAQIARGRAGAIEEGALRECAARTGAAFCVAAGLDLAARTFRDAASEALLARLNWRWPRRRTRLLITPRLIASAQGPNRRAGSWRRQLLRQMLKSRR